jgi:hypothetical protein
VLGCLQVPVAQHLGHRYNWHPIAQGNRHSERMSGNMEGQPLVSDLIVKDCQPVNGRANSIANMVSSFKVLLVL